MKLTARDGVLWNPIGDKNIELSRVFGVTRRSEDQFFPVPREHWETIEAGAVSDPLHAGAIDVDRVQRKAPPVWVVQVRGKDNLAVVGVQEGRPVRRAVVGQLSFV